MANPVGPKDKEHLAEIWDFARIVDIDKEPDHLIIKVYTNFDGILTNIVIENMNGLKTYGTRREPSNG